MPFRSIWTMMTRVVFSLCFDFKYKPTRTRSSQVHIGILMTCNDDDDRDKREWGKEENVHILKIDNFDRMSTWCLATQYDAVVVIFFFSIQILKKMNRISNETHTQTSYIHAVDRHEIPLYKLFALMFFGQLFTI